jgi:hypothetical protein
MAFIAAKMMAFGGVLRGGMWTKEWFFGAHHQDRATRSNEAQGASY